MITDDAAAFAGGGGFQSVQCSPGGGALTFGTLGGAFTIGTDGGAFTFGAIVVVDALPDAEDVLPRVGHSAYQSS